MSEASSNRLTDSAAVFDSTDPTSPVLTVNMTNVTKLTSANYIGWSQQISFLLEGHGLHGFINGTIDVPTEVVTTDGLTKPNPAFTHWKRQDRLIHAALLGAISNTTQTLVSRATSSLDLWVTLERTYGLPTRGHIKQLKNQLKHLTKGTKSIDEYMRTARSKADQLALLGKPLDHEDLMDYVLDGLPDEYNSVADAANGRETPMSFVELHEKLLNREADLLHLQPASPMFPVTANAVNTRPRGNWRSSSPAPMNQGQRENFRRPYLGKCQLCGIQGHSAKFCSQLSQFKPPGFTPSYRQSAPPVNQPWRPSANTVTYTYSDSEPWLVDSGASHHVTSDLNNLAAHNPYIGSDQVIIGDGSQLPITHSGSTSLPLTSHTLKNVLYVPSIKKNLISANRFCVDNDVSVELFPQNFQVKDLRTGTRLLTGPVKNGLYEWPTTPATVSAFSASKPTLSEWHARLGHPAPNILKSILLQTTNSSFGDSLSFDCHACLSNKSHKLPFHNSSITTSRPLEILFSDLWSSPVYSFDNFKYYLILVDHYTRYMWYFPLKQKSQVQETFIRFKSLVENSFNTKIGSLYSDNGGEYLALSSFLAHNGINHYKTPPHTPEHNGLSERRHRHIVETGLALLTQASMPNTYWSYAFATAVYLINRMPTPTLGMRSPYFSLFSKEPNYSKLHIFGCLCYPWLRPYASHKLDHRSLPCVFLGYSLSQSAFYCLDPQSSRIYISRHVRFCESSFPFKSVSSEPSPSPREDPAWFPAIVPLSPTRSPLIQPTQPPVPVLAPSPDSHLDENGSSDHSSDIQTANARDEEEDVAPAPPIITSHHPMKTRSKNNVYKPNKKYSLTISTATTVEPATVTQALLDPRWRNSMGDEFNSIVRNGTFELVPPELAHNIIGCKWVFRTKYLPNGSVDRFKSRLVAKGFHQRPGIDFHETFSPVVKPTTIRVVLGVAISKDWSIKQLDVNNAFLQGNLDEEVYMKQPPGFIDKDNPTYVCRLKKAIYGLKQAPRAWYNELRQFLLLSGFHNSLADASLFVYRAHGVILYLLVYVDDIIITGSSSRHIQEFTDLLAARFSIKDLGQASYFLGIEVTRSARGLFLCQRKYVIDLLRQFKMENAKPLSTPLCASTTLSLHAGTVLDNPTEYRALVGSLQYLALTRPDLAFATTKLSQFMHQPTSDHWGAAKRVLRYLAGTPTTGIFLSRTNNLTLHAFSDADWAGNKDDYTSTSAHVVFLGQHPVSWSSKKLQGVARSSTEAEYRSVATTASEVRWIASLLQELGLRIPQAPVIYCDNVGATYLCANPVFHSRMKHIALDYHFIREQVQAGTLRVTHVSSADQLADALTKPLSRPRFELLFRKIGLANGGSS